MPKTIGPAFGDEVHAAGLGGLPFAWMPGGTEEQISSRERLTAEQNAKLDEVIAAHDPEKQPMPTPAPEDVVLYEHENRIRALEGQPPLELREFLTKAKLIKVAPKV